MIPGPGPKHSEAGPDAVTDPGLDRRARQAASAGALDEVEELLTRCAAEGLALRAEMLRLDRRRAELRTQARDEVLPDEVEAIAARLELLNGRWATLSSHMAALRIRRDALAA